MGVEISLAGKNAVVTGGGGGMGRTTSMLLGQAGANVMVADMDVAAAEKTAADIAAQFGVKTAFCKCNVTVKAEVDAMVEATLKAFGRIDILNNIDVDELLASIDDGEITLPYAIVDVDDEDSGDQVRVVLE